MTGRDRTVHAYVDVNDPLVRLPAFTLLEFCNFSLAKFLASISLYFLNKVVSRLSVPAASQTKRTRYVSAELPSCNVPYE